MSALSILKKAVQTRGLINVAALLGHDSTDRVKRWLADNRVPKTQEFAVKFILGEKVK